MTLTALGAILLFLVFLLVAIIMPTLGFLLGRRFKN